MQIIGNIVLALAALLYLLPLPMLMAEASRRHADGGALWGAIFLFVPLGALLTLALLLATARGAFDWLPVSRGPQYLLVLMSGLACLTVMLFSFLGTVEPAQQIPWAALPFRGWALYAFPPLIMGFALLALNPALGKQVPALIYRAPISLISVASWLACAGLIGQWISHSQQQQAARVARAIAEGNERDRDILARVQTLNTTNDFTELLGFANRFETEAIRRVALEKVQAEPQFITRLAGVLQGYWAEKGLVYLDACEVSAADRQTLAEPVRTAIAVRTKEAEDNIEHTHTFYAEQFDGDTRLILSVTEKFETSGVDYRPAIRQFRAALDAPRGKDFNFNARHTLDAWLARQTTTVRNK